MEEEKPFGLGYRMPAEWEQHEATWLAWPKNVESFPGSTLAGAQEAYLEMMAILTDTEKVKLLVDDEKSEADVSELLESSGVKMKNLEMMRIPTVDVWFRDYGPIFITRTKDAAKQVAFTHWKFNAWGNKYAELVKDTYVPENLGLEKFKRFDVQMVLEGGSVDVNGSGSCLTTEQCLLNKNRNPELSKQQIADNLRDYLGITNMIWLKSGLEGDDTDGHVDDIARFVSRDTVVCALEENKEDKNYGALAENYEILKGAKDQEGKELKLLTLPMPRSIEYMGQRLPASYTNFYIANNIVLVPIFGDENDKRAIRILKGAFPNRRVFGVNSVALVVGFGAIHCVTQQQPSG